MVPLLALCAAVALTGCGLSDQYSFMPKLLKQPGAAPPQLEPRRFGVLELSDSGNVQNFREKPDNEIGWINGGFFVCEPSVFDYIEGDATSWERTPLERLAREGELMAYQHTGFWKPMDTLRDKRELEELWANGRAPWKTWVIIISASVPPARMNAMTISADV
jgi:NDP-sugar pyrophosphorylase family protein